MGFITSFSRAMYLTNYINSKKMELDDAVSMQLGLANEISRLASEISDIGDNNSAAVKQLKARETELKMLDKELQARIERLKNELQAAVTQKQSTDNMLQADIQSSFSYRAG